MSTRIDRTEDRRIEEAQRQDAQRRTEKTAANKQAFQQLLQKQTEAKAQEGPNSTARKILQQLTGKADPKTLAAQKKASGSQSDARSSKSDTDKKADKADGDGHKKSDNDGQTQHLTENAVGFNPSQNQSGGSNQNSGSSDSDDDAFFAQTANLARTQEAQAALEKALPNGFFDDIADKIYVGVNDEGLSHFTIELKAGVLSGGTLDVSANGKAISLIFRGLEESNKRLIQASQNELAGRLQKKGLYLSKVDMA